MFENYRNKQKAPPATSCIISIADQGELQMKICCKVAGDITDLTHALRDERIVDPAEIYQKMLAMGFQEILQMTRTERLTPDGKNEEPKEKDTLREKFSDTEYSPFGRGQSLFMDMSGEFKAARSAELRKTKWR